MQQDGTAIDAIASRIYQDEPILMTARPTPSASILPPRYREMKQLAARYGVYEQSGVIIFCKQAGFMEDFEDDFDYSGEFTRYFPTYQAMNDRQLRGYFSWRTRVRRGRVEGTSLSFVFVYLYELLNQIGVGSPEEGFHTLRNFWQTYREIDSGIDRYCRLWLKDYIVYHNLDRSLFDELSDPAPERAALTLMNYGEHSAEEVCAALDALSSYRLENSVFFKQHPEEVREVVRGVFAALSEYYSKNRKNGICETLFGKIHQSSYSMFRSAVFFDRQKHRDYLYEVNGLHRYRCREGSWSCERFLRYNDKLRQTGALLKAVDFLMRREYGFKSALKEEKITGIHREIILREIAKFRETRRKTTLPPVEIDVARLRDIRKTAFEIQNRLLVEEPEELPEPAVSRKPEAVSAAEPADGGNTVGNATGLDETEFRFLRCLLRGEPYEEFLREQKRMPSLLVDSINETLFDRFADTVIVYDGERPEVVREYLEELKGIAGT